MRGRDGRQVAAGGLQHGLGRPGVHAQVLWNQRVGSRCNVAASGPRLIAVI